MSDEDWMSLRLEAEHLFTPGTAIKEQDLFAGRQGQLDKLSQRIRLAGSHAVIYGERGVGKSSLVNIFRYVADRSPSRVQYIRVAVTGGDTFPDIFRKIFKRIQVDVDGESTQLSTYYTDKDISPDDVLLEMENFSAAVVPIVVIDEYDRIKDDATKTKISDTIKLLSDEGARVTFFIVGVADAVNDLLQGHGSIGRAMAEIEMPRMSDSEVISIILDRIRRAGMTANESALWKCVFICKGLPHFAHLMGLHAMQAACDRKSLRIKDEDINEATKRALENTNRSLQEDFERAIYSERNDNIFLPVLIACALAAKDSLGMFTAKDVGRVLHDITGENYEVPAFSYHLNEFCSENRGEILKKYGKKRQFKYRFDEAMLEPQVILEGLRRNAISKEIVTKYSPSRQADLFSSAL